MPCNTAHADPIFNEILNHIPTEIKFIHMIRQVANFIKTNTRLLKRLVFYLLPELLFRMFIRMHWEDMD